MPARRCSVSFTDSQGITHSAEVIADSLYEAIALGLHEMRASGLVPVMPGPATAVTVRLKSTADAEHTVTLRQFDAWLSGTARSPKERLVKERLRQMAGD